MQILFGWCCGGGGHISPHHCETKTYIVHVPLSSSRWVRSAGKRIPMLARLVICMYAIHMGYVDRVDKNVALSRLRLKRCMKRYHRAIFVWFLAIIFNNVMVLFALLFSDVEELAKAKEASGIGFKHWIQLTLGTELIRYGLEVARTERIQQAAMTITRFMCLASYKLRRKKKKVASEQRAGTRRIVLIDRTNTPTRKKRAGRPKKRRRTRVGAGRPAAPPTSASSCAKLVIIHIQFFFQSLTTTTLMYVSLL